MSRRRLVFLVGFMGSGKTAVGRALAGQLGWGFEDTDARVEESLGRSIESIFRDCGEGRFREAEWDTLRSLAGRDSLVVATGGGLFLGVVQRGFMREHGISVWLDVPLDRIRERLGEGAGRPLWPTSDPAGQRAFFERRRAAYALADLRVDAGTGASHEIAARIVPLVNRLPR